MSNIHHLNRPYREALTTTKITDELLQILYDLSPLKISFWNLKLAKVWFNNRLSKGNQTWFDKLQVYVGLPDWVVTEEQMLTENLPHLMLPLGLLNDIGDASEASFNIAVPHFQKDTLNGSHYTAFHHTTSFEFCEATYKLEKDILNNKNEFEGLPDQYERLIKAELQNVCEKKELVLNRLWKEAEDSQAMETLATAISTCRALASGDKKLLEEFLQIEDAKDNGSEVARRVYSNLDIEDFFEWASDHFGLDQYYESSEHLVDHIKWIIECEPTRLICNEGYIFITKIIGRSSPLYGANNKI